MDGYKIQDKKQESIILFIACLAVFVSSVDTSIVNIILPTLTRFFHAEMGQVLWVTILYMIVLTGFLVIFGKLGDSKGYRKIFVAGFLLFTIGSFLCGTSDHLRELIFYRVIQALGGAMIKSVGVAIITVFLAEEKRGEFLGIYAMAGAIGFILGPVVGGLLTHYFGWQWVLFVNIPFGILGFFLSHYFIPREQPPTEDKSIDTFGSVLFIAFISISLLSINMGKEFGWTSLPIIGGFILSFILFIVFYYYEQKVKSPFIDFSLLKNHQFVINNLASIMVYFAFSGSLILLPFYFELLKGFTVKKSGVFLVILSIANLIVSKVSGGFSDRIGCKKFCAAGALFSALSFFLAGRLSNETGEPYIIMVLIFLGVSLALFLPPSSSIIMASVPEDKKGFGASLMITLKTLAAVYGVCLFESIFSESLPRGIHLSIEAIRKGHIAASDLVSGIHNAYTLGTVICIAAFLVTLAAKEIKTEKKK